MFNRRGALRAPVRGYGCVRGAVNTLNIDRQTRFTRTNFRVKITATHAKRTRVINIVEQIARARDKLGGSSSARRPLENPIRHSVFATDSRQLRTIQVLIEFCSADACHSARNKSTLKSVSEINPTGWRARCRRLCDHLADPLHPRASSR